MSELIGIAIQKDGVVHEIYPDGKVIKVGIGKQDNYHIRFSSEGIVEYRYDWDGDDSAGWGDLLACCGDKDLARRIIELYTTYIVETGLSLYE